MRLYRGPAWQFEYFIWGLIVIIGLDHTHAGFKIDFIGSEILNYDNLLFKEVDNV